MKGLLEFERTRPLRRAKAKGGQRDDKHASECAACWAGILYDEIDDADEGCE